jgi:hypothetical protein
MRIFISIFLVVIWFLTSPVCPRAEVVGRFLKVEGAVDLLKKGKPALTPKVQDGLEPGDVIQTRTQGRAQVKFVDDSVLTIAPDSKVGIESYMYDKAKGSRNAVLQVFQGLVKTAVAKIFQTREPNFMMKTSTAILGVRGTEWYALLGPHGTDVYNKSGRVWVRNINRQVEGEVYLNAMERTRVGSNKGPLTPMAFQMQDLAFMDQQLGGDGGGSSGGGGGGGSSSSGGDPPSGSYGGSGAGGASGVPAFGSTAPSFFPLSSSGASPSSTASGIKLWTGGSGWWNDLGVPSGTSNWTSAGAPLNGNSAYLTQTDAIDRTVNYNNTAPVLLNELRVDATGSGNMTLNQATPSSLLTANDAYVGYDGRGFLAQSSGTNVINNNLYLGYNPGSSGNYELSGDAQLLTTNLFVGYSGSGTFTQSGGVNNVSNQLTIAANPGSSGTYNLQNGNLSAGGITVNSGGVFNQTGGTLESGGLDNRGAVNLSGGTTTVTGNTSNQGTVRVSNTTVTWAGDFINSGAYISDPATQSFTNLTITSTGYLVGGAGDRWEISNDFVSHSVMNLSWNTLAAALIFTSGTDTAHSLYITGADYGSLLSGYTNNFAWGLLDLTGQSLTLFDGNDQAGGALYVGEIILGYTPECLLLASITGNGLNIYYDPELNPYLEGLIYELTGGGYLIPIGGEVPVPASAWLFLSGLAALGLGRLRRPRRK